MVPDYCVGQNVAYLKERGFSKSDFSKEQIELDRWMNTQFHISEEYRVFCDLIDKKRGYLKRKVECASGTYTEMYRPEKLTEKQ